MDHVFIACPFYREVWNGVTQLTIGKSKWDETNMVDCLFHWLTCNIVSTYKALPCLFVLIWCSMYLIVFQGSILTIALVAHQVRLAWFDHKITLKEASTRVLRR